MNLISKIIALTVPAMGNVYDRVMDSNYIDRIKHD
jgi:hypothetical protein